jgi:tetratricopeptide (TPR) repeat protein
VIVPSTKHVVPWQRKEQKDSSKPTYMDNLLIGLMEHLALEDYQMGRWDRAMERYLWILEWNSAIGKHNTDPKKPYELKREDADAYRNAKLVMAGILDKLGYREKALTLVDQGLERKKKSIYSNKQLKLLEVMRARLTWQQGKGDAALLGKLNAIIALEGKDPGVPVGAMDSARLMKADCLASMGRKGEAETLLKSICERKKRSALGWLDAELALVNLDLSQARWASAEKKLHELMQAVRLKGVKIEELDLYQMYVQWALMSGKWEEALRGQREVLRLLEAFRMTPLLPLEQARLARILAELGNIAESEAQAKLAKSGATGRGAHFTDRIEQELNELKNRANVIAKSKVRMQPRSVMTAPIAGFPSRTVLTLINHGTAEAKGAIKVSGLPATITWDEKTSHAVVEVTDAQGGTKEQTSGEIRIAAGRMAQVSCFGKLNSENARKVLLEWVGDDRQSCEWSIENGDKESDGAVIDAGSYDHDPFFMIPVHHHLQCKVKGSVNLRVVTSKPCRVELYDEKGGLQMVDAEGNGSLKDSGDWLGADRDRNLAAEIFADATTGETRFLLLLDPAQEIEKEALKVRVEWLMDGKWYPAAEDQITPGK